MNKTLIIDAFMWYFGCGRIQAAAMVKNNPSIVSAVVQSYNDQAKKAFYND